MHAIFKREFRSYFQTVIGWLFIAVSLCIYGLYYYMYNFIKGSASVSYPISAITFVCLITVPVLSMRCLADEKRTRTDQLLLTSPVSVGQLVLGKFLAIAAVFSITIAIYAVSPLFLCAFGKASLKISYVAILGYWLYGLSCIAISVFISSLTESQVISAVLSFLALFAGYLMNSICNAVSTTGNIFTKILRCYDLTSHMDNFFNGCLDVVGIVYYLSLIAVFLFFTTQSIQKRRWTVTKNSWKTGVFGTAFLAVALAMVIAVNFAVGQLPTTVTNIDVTAQKMYSISKDSYKVLDGLKEDVTIYVLAKEGTFDATVSQTLKRYEDGSKHVKVEYKDPAVAPNFYTTYTDQAPSAQSLIVVSKKRSTVVDYSKLYATTVDYNTYQQKVTGYDAEGQITSAIAYVTSDDMPKVYCITGHNEVALSGDFADALKKANITTENLNLMECDVIPEDAAGVIINAPTADFSDDDAEKVKTYLSKGKKALVQFGYTTEDLKNFKSILADYEIAVADGVVAEADQGKYYQNPFYLLPDVQSNEMTANCNGTYIFAPNALGMTHPQETKDKKLSITDLLKTSEDSYAKTDVQNATSYDKEDGDVAGPFAIGLYAQKEGKKKDQKTELMVFSSSALFTDETNQRVAGNNANLFKNCIAKFQNDKAQSVVIPVKNYEFATLTIPAAVSMMVGFGAVILIPLALLAAGILIWIRRRRR